MPPILAKISNSLERREMPAWWRWAYRGWLRVQGRCLDHVVGMALPMAEEIGEGLGVPPGRITIIPDPALSEAIIARLRMQLRRPKAEPNARRFVAVGRLAAQKNTAMMLRAFHRGAGEGDRLTIIGDGPERTRLAALAADLGLASRAEFLGYVPEPVYLLRHFDVCLLSSDYEGVPAIVLEALAAGLPVVATDCSRSMSSLLLDGALGRLVAVGDEPAFAAAIAAAGPQDSDNALSLAQARRFTIELAGSAYLGVMARLVMPSVRSFGFGSPADLSYSRILIRKVREI